MATEQIKIISDGNGYTTSILDCNDKPIKGVSRIEIIIEPHSLVKAVLTFDNVILGVIAESELGENRQDGSE